jgi:hypothetical protein
VLHAIPVSDTDRASRFYQVLSRAIGLGVTCLDGSDDAARADPDGASLILLPVPDAARTPTTIFVSMCSRQPRLIDDDIRMLGGYIAVSPDSDEWLVQDPDGNVVVVLLRDCAA